MHYLFIGFLLLGIAAAVIRALFGAPEALSGTMDAMFSAADMAVQVSIGLIGVLTLWTGLFRLAEKSGLAEWVARRVAPLLGRLMPEARYDTETGTAETGTAETGKEEGGETKVKERWLIVGFYL